GRPQRRLPAQPCQVGDCGVKRPTGSVGGMRVVRASRRLCRSFYLGLWTPLLCTSNIGYLAVHPLARSWHEEIGTRAVHKGRQRRGGLGPARDGTVVLG